MTDLIETIWMNLLELVGSGVRLVPGVMLAAVTLWVTLQAVQGGETDRRGDGRADIAQSFTGILDGAGRDLGAGSRTVYHFDQENFSDHFPVSVEGEASA